MLPDTTHLQFLVLDYLLAKGEMSGHELRSCLAEESVSKSGPAFYQLMARMEDAKYVSGRYEEKIVDGQRIKERRYEIAAAGERARNEVMKFYQERDAGLKGECAHA